jgi:hypothetical protein
MPGLCGHGVGLPYWNRCSREHGCSNTEEGIKQYEKQLALNVFIHWHCKSFPRGLCSSAVMYAAFQEQLQYLVFQKRVRQVCLSRSVVDKVKTSVIPNRGHVSVTGTEKITLLSCKCRTLWRPILDQLIVLC